MSDTDQAMGDRGTRGTADIVVPQVGEAVADIVLVRWLKSEGDQIRKGDVLFEVDTDKYVVEIEAFADGLLVETRIPAGTPVTPLQVVGRFVPEDESLVLVPPGIERPGQFEETRETPPQEARRLDTGGAERVLASPKARRMATELDIDIGTLAGSGPQGLITAEDVELAAAQREVRLLSTERPLTKLRRSVAERTQESKMTVPHFYLLAETDMSEASRLRTFCRDELGWEEPPSVTDLVVSAAARALETIPAANVIFAGDRLVQRDSIDIGIAVGLDDGILVPILREANRLGLPEIVLQTQELVDRARRARLHAADVVEKSMVVSNLGMYGVDAFVAIIDMPDPMILAVGRVADRCVPENGVPAIRPMCTLTLSVDHRALDGVIAARFLGLVKERLEHAHELLEA